MATEPEHLDRVRAGSDAAPQLSAMLFKYGDDQPLPSIGALASTEPPFDTADRAEEIIYGSDR